MWSLLRLISKNGVPQPTHWDSISDRGCKRRFIELRAATSAAGSRLSYKYKTATETEFASYSALAVKDTYGFVVPETAVQPGVFKLSNFSPTRMFVKLSLIPPNTRICKAIS